MAFMKVMVTSNDTGIVVHGMTTMQRRLQYGATPIQVALCHPFKTLVIFGPNILYSDQSRKYYSNM